MSEIVYHPLYGCVRPNGDLRIPTSKPSEDGKIWEGAEEVGPDYPSYAEWRHVIEHKEQHIATMREERQQARAALRRAAEWKHAVKRAEG